MAIKIKIKHGPESGLAALTTEAGEIIVTDDTQKLMIGTDSNEFYQPICTSIYNTTNNYLISGEIKPLSGSDNYINPYFISLAENQTANIIGYVGKLQSGSAIINIKRNDTNVVSNINISDSISSGSCDISLSNFDMLNIEVSSSVSASNLSFGLIVENICQ